MNLDETITDIAGVDGCHGGWLCIEEIADTVKGRIFRTFNDLMDGLSTAAIIAIDVPIGLAESSERPCDKAARKLLGPQRASSVFPAPIRGVLSIKDYPGRPKKTRSVKEWSAICYVLWAY